MLRNRSPVQELLPDLTAQTLGPQSYTQDSNFQRAPLHCWKVFSHHMLLALPVCDALLLGLSPFFWVVQPLNPSSRATWGHLDLLLSLSSAPCPARTPVEFPPPPYPNSQSSSRKPAVPPLLFSQPHSSPWISVGPFDFSLTIWFFFLQSFCHPNQNK